MKRIFFLVAVLILQGYAASIPAEGDQKLSDFDKECKNVVGAVEDLLEQLGQSTDPMNLTDPDKLFAEHEKLRQYLVCYYTKGGLMNDKGVVQKDTLRNGLNEDHVDKAKVDRIVNKCGAGDVHKDTPAETAYELFKCLKPEIENLKH